MLRTLWLLAGGSSDRSSLKRAGSRRQFLRGGGRRSLRLEQLEDRALLAAGDLDPSFGIGGKVTTDFSNGLETGVAVTQSDGKIVMVGRSQVNGFIFAVARYDQYGNLDPEFDGDGRITISFGGLYDLGTAVAIQPDGKILIAGYTSPPGFNTADFAIARLNVDGSFDTGFGTGGKVTIDFGSSLDQLSGIAVQESGRIVVAGSVYRTGIGWDFAAARLLSNGTPDGSFGVGGQTFVDFGGSPESCNSLALQSDGKILLGGWTYPPGLPPDFAVARLDSDGVLDATFDGDGKQTIDFGSYDFGGQVTEQPGGSIVITGYTELGSSTSPPTYHDFAIAQLESDGSPDATFGTDGKVTIDFGASLDYGGAVAIQPDDGRIVLGGTSSGLGMASDFALVRLEPNGDVDDSFGDCGLTTIDFGDNDVAAGITLADGKIVIAGTSNYDFALARLDGGSGSVCVPNQAPVAVDDAYEALEDQSLEVVAENGVLANDTDLDGDELSALLVSGPSYGDLTLGSDGSFVYVAVTGFSGQDSFTYRASDGRKFSSVVTVYLNVSATNDAPVAADDFYWVDEDTTLDVGWPGLVENDVDVDGDALSVILEIGPTNGSFALNADGSFVYTPDANYNGLDSFTYRASDNQVVSDLATVWLFISAVNDVPAASDDSYVMDEDTTLNVGSPGLLDSDSDVDLDPLTAGIVSLPTHGTLNLNADGSFAYVPDTDYTGPDSFRYVANDGQSDGNVATVSITVNAVNDVPVANDDGYLTTPNLPLTIGGPGLLTNDTDGDGDVLVITAVTVPSHGTLTMSDDGSFSYSPATNFAGTDSFTYRVSDGDAASNVATVTISVVSTPAGSLDPTFGVGGKITTDFPKLQRGSERANAVQFDGKIVVLGQTGVASNNPDFAVARYDLDGALDENFGDGGRVTIDFGFSADFPAGLAIDSQGRILVTGSSSRAGGSQDNMVVARLDTYGDLDATFGGGGKLIVSSPGSQAHGIAIQGQKIVLAGSAEGEAVVMRLNENGTFDDSFNGNGKRLLGLQRPAATSVAIDDDGRIVVQGGGSVARLKENGEFDETFNAGSVRTLSIGTLFDVWNDLALQPDGKIVLAGYARFDAPGFDWAVARLNEDGSLDESFDGDGVLTFDFGNGIVYDVEVQESDSKIVLAGWSYEGIGTGEDFAVARLNTNGSFDTMFDVDGKATIDFGSDSDEAWSMGLQPDGSVLLAGFTSVSTTGLDFAICRLNSIGVIDNTFDGDGRLTTDFPKDSPSTDFFPPGVNLGFARQLQGSNPILVQQDGKIVVAGSSGNEEGLGFAVARYNSNGSLDTSFSEDGRAYVDAGPYGAYAYGVAVDGDGNIIVAGTGHQDTTSYDFILARLTSTGALDTSFGDGGIKRIDFSSGFDVASDVIVSGQTIIIAGFSDRGTASRYDFAIAWLDANGNPVELSGDEGKRIFDLGSIEDFATSMALQRVDNKIVVAGSTHRESTGYDFAAIRITSERELDPAFSDGEKQTVDFGSWLDIGADVGLLSDGSIVLAGYSEQSSSGGTDIAVALLDPDGNPVTTFGDSGLKTIDFGNLDVGAALAITGDDRIVVVGSATDLDTGIDFAVARLNSNGQFDNTFHEDGKVTIDFGPSYYDFAYGVALQNDGRIIVAGHSYQLEPETYDDFAIARLLGDNSDDSDGVEAAIENGAPNNGDGNGDGIPDSQQSEVASLPNSADGQYLTLKSPLGTSLVDVGAISNPSPTDSPEGVEFPVGHFTFAVEQISGDGTTTVTLYLPDDTLVNTYYKYGPTPDNTTPHWYEFLFDGTTGAEIFAGPGDDPQIIVLHFVDGQRGDDDLMANSQVHDPGSPAFRTNHAPAALAISTNANEDGQPVTLAASFTDVDASDIHTFTIDTTGTIGSVTNNDDGTFAYDPNGQFEYLAVGETATDAFAYTVDDGHGGTSTATATATIHGQNDAPSVATDNASVTSNEGQTVANSGTFGDVDLSDSVTITASKGMVTQIGSNPGTWSWSYFGADDEATHTVTITADDGNGGIAMATFQLTVNNVNPTATDNSYSTPQTTAVSGNLLMDGVDDSDPAGANDPLTVLGNTNPANGTVVVSSNGSFIYTPDSTFTGTDNFTYTISDGDGGTDTATVTITVSPAAAGSVLTVPDTCCGGTAVLVTGTSAGDLIVVSPGSGNMLDVSINGASTSVAIPSGRIIVIGGAGDDNIQIAGSIVNQVWLYGEAGDDRLNAGNGGSVLIGGDGNDYLLGGAGRDVMVGGKDADHLVGNSNDDILVASLTIYDNRSAAGHEDFWCSVLAEWNADSATDTFGQRVNRLRTGAGVTGVNLFESVIDDLAADDFDFLNGAAGDDWLIFLAGEDRVAGRTEAAN